MYGSQVSASSIIRPRLGVSVARAIGLSFNLIIIIIVQSFYFR